jgi:transcriptional regulator with XRE-family HTH domain
MNRNPQILLMLLGRNISRIRKKKGYTQTRLADELEMDRSNLRRIEAGRTNPTATTLFRICRVLSVHVVQLFDFDENEEGQE